MSSLAGTKGRASLLRRPFLFMLSALLVPLTLAQAEARGAPESFADLAEKLLPAVVNISTTQAMEDNAQADNFDEFFKDFFERRGRPAPDSPRRAPSALGSGFVIDPSGYVVTNNHVIEGADDITVNFADGSSHSAELIGTGPPSTMLA